ncbi:MAG: RNA methyltransferase [Lentimicrobium sp.]|nr:RNA methyltransferase [Lentimicrobium sp.]
MEKLSMSELNRMTVEDFKNASKIPLIVILDNIRSQHNTGSVFRTSDAFRVDKIILCGITATPPNREIQKTALGATESVDWEYNTSTLDAVLKLKQDGYVIVAAEQAQGSIIPDDFIPEKDKKYVLIFGNEVSGVSDEVMPHCDICIEIPQYGTKHSLNVSVSAGILIWDLFLKFRRSNQF